jgi:hypothetical protein
VEPFPTYDPFSSASREEIIGELAACLTVSETAGLARTPSDSWF